MQKNAPQKTTTFDIDRNLALANIDSNVDILKIHLDYHTKNICPITGNVIRPGADIKRDLNRLNDYVIYWNGYFQTDNLQNLTHIIRNTHCRIAKYGFQLKRVELHPLEEVKKISFYLYAASVRLIIHDNPSFFDHTLFNDYILYKTKNKLPFEAEDIVDEMVRIRHYSII